MICPVCHNEIKSHPEPLALQLVCHCQPNKRTSFGCTFKTIYSGENELENFNVFLWLNPEKDDSTKWYRITYFWRKDNYWQVNLYTKDHKLLDHGKDYHSPEQAWKMLQRYKELLVFS